MHMSVVYISPCAKSQLCSYPDLQHIDNICYMNLSNNPLCTTHEGNVLGAVEHWSITFDFLLHQLFCLSCMLLLHLGWPFILWSIRFLSSYQCEVLCIYCTCFVFTRYSLLTLVSEAICHLIYPFRWQVSI